MSKWQQVNLGDAIDILSGYAFKSKDFCDKGVPVLKIQNVTNSGVLLNEDTVFVSEDTAAALLKYKIHYDDILITMTGSNISQFNSVVGRVSKVKFAKPAMLNQRVGKILLKDKDSFCLDYIFYFLSQESTKIKLAQKASGSANQANISPAIIKSLKIPMLPIEVQRKIADVLSAYDDLIENNRKQIKLLEEAAQRLYKEWFIDLRFPGHETTPITNGIPEGWERKPISAIAEYLNGFAFKPSDWQKEGKPIIKIKEMNQGISDDTPRNNGDCIPAKYLIKAGDILFSWSATLSVMIWNQEDGWLNQHLFKVTPAAGISREFVLQAISNTLSEFQNLTTGATMKHIQRGKLDEVFVNVPKSTVMNMFFSHTEPIRNKILTLSSKIKNAMETRDRLLPKLMTYGLEVNR